MIGGWRRLRRYSMIVSLDTGKSFEGVLVKADGSLLKLAHVRVLERGQQATAVDGEVVIPLGRVEFLQVLSNGTRP